MGNRTNILNWAGLICLNVTLVLFVIGLQFLYYGTAPAINPNVIYKDNFDKKAAFIEATMNFNKTLIIEMVVGALIIFFINYFYFRKTTQKPIRWTLLALFIFLILTRLGLIYFTTDYVNRNIGM